MFGFFRNRRAIRDARTKIGIDLHRQIRDALAQDEKNTAEMLSTSFTAGYIYWFVRLAFDCLGVNGERAVESELQHICDGVLSKKLYDIYNRQMAALQLATTIKDEDRVLPGVKFSPAQAIAQYDLASKAARYDAPLVSLQAIKASNLTKYLLGQKLTL